MSITGYLTLQVNYFFTLLFWHDSFSLIRNRRTVTDNEVKALELAKANGGKLTRNPAGFWQGKDGKTTAETVSNLVKQKLMFYSARRDVFPKFATEATIT